MVLRTSEKICPLANFPLISKMRYNSRNSVSDAATDTGCEGVTGMNHQILKTLQLYLLGDIDIDSLEDRIIPLAWETAFKDQELLDEILFELIYIKDGVSDESIFRTRVAEIARRVPAAVNP